MRERRVLRLSEAWFRLLMRLYPADFRESMGGDVVATYMMRARARLSEGGRMALVMVWLRALQDSLRNGPGERARPAARWRRSGNWGRDTELAWRRLRRAPLFVATMVGTLGIGIGAFGVVYTTVHKVIIAPLPYERPEDLYFIWRDYTWLDLDRGALAGTDVVELQREGNVIEHAAAILTQRPTLTGAAGTEPVEIRTFATSPDLFELLGARAALGRLFRDDEVGPGAPLQVVLTHQLWKRLGADRSIVGSDIRLNGQPHAVIGVLDEAFTFARHTSPAGSQYPDAYVALQQDLAATDPGDGTYSGIIRARPGSSAEVVKAAVAAAGERIDQRDHNDRGVALYAVGAHEDLIREIRPSLVLLAFAGSFLLLVLIVNLATLLLTRVVQREQEFAVSRALGANPLAVVRATLLEGGLLGLMGGAAAAAVASWGTRALVAMAPEDMPRRLSISVDWQMALTITAVGVASGFVAAILPAVWSTRTNMSMLLRNAAVRGGGGHGTMRRGMVVLQVALSLVLLTTGGLVVRSFEGLLRHNPGFDGRGVLTMRIPVSRAVYPEDSDIRSLHHRIQTELAGLPGVTATGATAALPLSGGANSTTVVMPGAPGNKGDPQEDQPLVDYINVLPGYFDAMGIRVLQGTPFRHVAGDAPAEVVIDRTLAEKFFPAGGAVGATLLVFGDTSRIVAVVEHARIYDVHEDGRGQVFIRNDRRTFGTLSWAIRSGRNPLDMMLEARSAIRRVDPQLAVADLQSMQQLADASLRERRLSATMIAAFSLGALLLAAMGIFGVVSAAVTRRRHELAVRIALGANHRAVLALVLGEGARLVALGLLLGLPGIYLAAQALRSILVGISPYDPATLITVAAGLGLVALVACYLPARRVLRIQPGSSLRDP